MSTSSLVRDCARCAALCCVALPFDAGDGFAFSKAANVPCENLCADNGCRIHPALAARGMTGCVAYDCARAEHGLRSGHDVDASVLDVFRITAWIHHQLRLLQTARDEPALVGLVDDIDAVAAALDAAAEETPEARWQARATTAPQLSALWAKARLAMPRQRSRRLRVVSG